MARIRSVKPQFFTSDTVSRLSKSARLTWIGLWTYCDDAGRGDGRLRIIYGALYPVDDRTTMADLEADLDELEKAERIVRYEVEGKPYLAVPNWGEHQHVNRPSKSHIPPPDVSMAGVFTEPSYTGSSSLEVGSSKREIETTPRAKRGTRLPEDWKPDEGLVAWAREQGYADAWARRQTEAFSNYWIAKPGPGAVKLDWRRTWMNWLNRAAETAGTPGKPAATPTPQPPQARDVLAELEARIAND